MTEQDQCSVPGHTRFKTAQEEFWAGEFGTNYVGRNADTKLVAANIALFARALQRTQAN